MSVRREKERKRERDISLSIFLKLSLNSKNLQVLTMQLREPFAKTMHTSTKHIKDILHAVSESTFAVQQKSSEPRWALSLRNRGVLAYETGSIKRKPAGAGRILYTLAATATVVPGGIPAYPINGKRFSARRLVKARAAIAAWKWRKTATCTHLWRRRSACRGSRAWAAPGRSASRSCPRVASRQRRRRRGAPWRCRYNRVGCNGCRCRSPRGRRWRWGRPWSLFWRACAAAARVAALWSSPWRRSPTGALSSGTSCHFWSLLSDLLGTPAALWSTIDWPATGRPRGPTGSSPSNSTSWRITFGLSLVQPWIGIVLPDVQR